MKRKPSDDPGERIHRLIVELECFLYERCPDFRDGAVALAAVLANAFQVSGEPKKSLDELMRLAWRDAPEYREFCKGQHGGDHNARFRIGKH